jgi:hypothetical protein
MDSRIEKTEWAPTRPARVIARVLAAFLLVVASACTPTEFRQMETRTPAKDQVPNESNDTPVTKADSFVQDESANKVDILIIDDNSYSMEVEQKKMAERFPSFVSALGDLDYQIAVTTTDIDSASSRLNLGGRVIDWSGTTSKLLTPRRQTRAAFSKIRSSVRKRSAASIAAIARLETNSRSKPRSSRWNSA